MGFTESVAATQPRRELATEYLIRIGRKNELDNCETHVMPHYDHSIVRPGLMDVYHLPSLTTECNVWPRR